MKDIVIVPTYDRPEYLSLCLKALLNASNDKEIWVCEDEHVDMPRYVQTVNDIAFVIDTWKSISGADIRHVQRHPHMTYGNSFNILKAFSDAIRSDARNVYLVEDDVMVQPDFFAWHETVQDKWSPFVSCAGRVNRSLNFEMNGREAIDETCKDPLACVASPRAYGSWASCFRINSLRAIVQSADAQCFLSSVSPGVEQDIFIQRLMPKTAAGFSVWPYVPRAYHMGWYSYHRTAGLKFNGTLSEKIRALAFAVHDPMKIRDMACLQEIDPLPLDPVPSWSGPLYLKADFRR